MNQRLLAPPHIPTSLYVKTPTVFKASSCYCSAVSSFIGTSGIAYMANSMYMCTPSF